ncbi:MAG: hypothetical protein ACRCZE_01390 [Candidatus Altimarinota bacterium]
MSFSGGRWKWYDAHVKMKKIELMAWRWYNVKICSFKNKYET